jgi:probable rRNA maturation factor
MQVTVLTRRRTRRASAAGLVAFTRGLARRAGWNDATEVTIVLAGDATLRRLNRTFRQKDKTTDVLSFPSGRDRQPDGSRPLGEIVISVAQADRQAREAGHSLAAELRVLVIHGYLHLLGYDHEVDDGTMMRLQARLARVLIPKARR